jgi:phosphatidylserine/phosphatidylglycerophosphate/cardiolipin synthase-like enzyme
MLRSMLVSFTVFALFMLGIPSVVANASQTHGTLQLLIEPEAGMGQVDQLLSSAHKSIDLEIYELSDTTIESILVKDEARGVDVRVILDKAYVENENIPAYNYLTSHHVAVHWAPSRFDLTHEKGAVIDGTMALVMTMNFTSRYYATTRDVVVIDTQSADVAAISATFNNDWQDGGTTATTGTDLVWSPGSEDALVSLIDSAHHSLYIENEEMNDTYITNALVSAARRGVKVTIVMTASSSWDGAFSTLTKAGVKIYTYPDTETALYIHAKVIDADPGYSDGRVFVGSENFSVASLVYNRELGLITASPTPVKDLEQMITEDAVGGKLWT